MNKLLKLTKKILTLLAVLTLTLSSLENYTDVPQYVICTNNDETNVEEQY